MSFHESQEEKDSETLRHHFYKTVTWLNYAFCLVWKASTFGYKDVILCAKLGATNIPLYITSCYVSIEYMQKLIRGCSTPYESWFLIYVKHELVLKFALQALFKKKSLGYRFGKSDGRSTPRIARRYPRKKMACNYQQDDGFFNYALFWRGIKASQHNGCNIEQGIFPRTCLRCITTLRTLLYIKFPEWPRGIDKCFF